MNNQALVRARCILRANNLVHRPKEPATAGVQNLMSSRVASSSFQHQRFAFSSVAQQEQSSKDRRPSALEQANLDVITPGHSIFVLQKYAADGLALIRQSDFIKLCESARPGKMKDAKAIATALKEFRHNNRFVLQKAGARAAVEGMIRSSIPNYKELYGKPRLHAAVFVADQIIDEKTALYFAIETELVDQVLGEIQQALTEMEERGMQLKIEIKEKASGDEDDDEKLLFKTLRVTEGLVKVLVNRSVRPEFNMKKRAARNYLKRLQTVAGPQLSTLKLATDIALSIGGAAVTQKDIVGPYAAAWWTKGVVDESILKAIADAESREEEAARAAAAAEEEAANTEDDSEAEEAGEGDEDAKDEKE
mmetsp:Transcript_10814/g.16312  ORF Transcript_10814/g.16312 Transcript_10814/m.16312 type:complete len:365 (+) Transcript_10814:80-1174(+)|eukprot:scaffold18555_cov146-Skeletonema_dohrnii-CCMP3373.AAC.7